MLPISKGYYFCRHSESLESTSDIILISLKIVGALGFFIFGMKVMSEGIQKFAGSRMRKILSVMTTNRFAGVFTGFLTTSLIQSSSATTVMVVSFVNAGLLKLRQAIGVIMGANIGTTVTAWLIAIAGFSKFSISAWALPVMAFGFPMLFSKNSKFSSLGEFLMGFGMIFLGLQFLKDSVKAFDLANNADFILWVNDLSSTGLFGILLFVLIGTALTVVVQSSSAAMAVTLAFIGNGLPFELGAAIVLGENIGTTITANIAAIIANVQAKRAARAHLIFNIFGVVWMLLVFTPFLREIAEIGENYFGFGDSASGEDANATRYGLSLFHTAFNIINTLVLVWFVNVIAKIVTRMVKNEGDEAEFSLQYIGTGMMGTPELSLLEAYKEVGHFGKTASKMNGFLRQLIDQPDAKESKKLIVRLSEHEELTDRFEIEIAKYLESLSREDLSDKTSMRVRALFSIANDLERIGDMYYGIGRVLVTKAENNIYFVPNQRSKILELIDLLENALVEMNHNLSISSGQVSLEKARSIEGQINTKRNIMRKQHLKAIEKGDYSLESGLIYVDIFSNLERIGDSIMSVSEAATGEI